VGQRRDEAQAAGVRDGCGEIGIADPLHPTLEDRRLDAEELGDAGS